jgi:putative alpha-1,2-mannosidase
VFRPFFDKITIDLPSVSRPLTISANGAPTMLYVTSIEVEGVQAKDPIVRHEQIANGGDIVFSMSDTPSTWPQ